MGCLLSIKLKYEDYDWSELPDEGRKAAEVLGYDERKWNKGKDTKVMKKYWDDLTDEEQIAATVLGYDDEMWDQS